MIGRSRLFALILFLIALSLLSGPFYLNSSYAYERKAGFEKEYENWMQNGLMHYEKSQYPNALLCFFKARRLKPGSEVDSMIEKVKKEVEKPQQAVSELPPIPLSDERAIVPMRNPGFKKNEHAKVKRVQYFRKNYGFLIFPVETMKLKDGDYFDAEEKVSNRKTADSKNLEEPADEGGKKNTVPVLETEDKKNAVTDSSEDDGQTSEDDSEPVKSPAEIKEYFVDVQDGDETYLFEGQTILRRGKRHGKMIALTFDDGPHPSYTQKLLKVLKNNDVKATFFMLGSRINEYKKVAAQVYAEGHDIGNHSYTHPFYTKCKTEKMDKEILKTDEAIKKITGYKEVKYLRPPYGALPKSLIKKAEDDGFYIVMWSLDSKDYQGHSVDYMLDKVLKRVKGGDVMLFHDIHSNTIKLIAELVPILKKAGFKFVKLSDIYDLDYLPQKEKLPGNEKNTAEVKIAGSKVISTGEVALSTKAHADNGAGGKKEALNPKNHKKNKETGNVK